MKELRSAFILFLLCVLTLSAQPVPVAGPFKISRDDTTASFLQDRPFTTTSNSLSFFVSWRDYRIYPNNLYGVRLNNQGLPETENLSFKKMWNEIYIAGFNNNYLSMSGVSNSFGMYGYTTYSGSLLSLNGTVIKYPEITELRYGDLIFSGLVTFSSFVKNSKLYLFSSADEQTTQTILDSNGIRVRQKGTTHSPRTGYTSARNSTGEFIAVYCEYQFNTIKIDCYNASDSITVNGKVLLQLPSAAVFRFIPPIKILPLKQNNFLVAIVCADTLYTIITTPSGNIVNSVGKYAFNAVPVNNYGGTYNFILTSVKDGLTDLFVTVKKSDAPTTIKTKIFSFSEYGVLADTSETSGFSGKISGGLFKIGRFRYLTADTSRGDIYLKEINNFSSTLVRKLNDDRGGTNEVEGQVVSDNAAHPFAVWYNGTQRQVQRFNSNGTPGNTFAAAPTINHFAHPNGTLRFLEAGANGVVLIRKYNTTLQFLGTDTLRTADSIIQNANKFTGTALPNNNILYVASTPQIAYTVLTSPDGMVLAADTMQIAGSPYYRHPAVYILGNDSLYIVAGSLARKYSFSLQRIGNTGVNSQGYFIAGDRFGYAFSEARLVPFVHQIFLLSMWRTDGSYAVYQKLLSETPPLTYYQSQVAYNRFGLFYKMQEGMLQFRLFDTTGLDVMAPLTIDLSELYYGGLSFSVADNNIYFVWSDNRNGNADVFCKIYPLSPFTGIEEKPPVTIPDKFYLSAVYPNPFNPSANVRYSLPAPGKVRLTVYNALGELVTTLFDGYRAPGEYTQTINGNTLPGGIYFVQLQSGSFSSTVKCVLLK